MKKIRLSLAFLGVVLVTALLSVLAVPFWIFDKKGWYMKYYPVLWGKPLQWLLGLDIEIAGKENLTPGENYVLVANHTSLLDIVSLNAVLRLGFTLAVKSSLFKVPFFNLMLKTSHVAPIKRGDKGQSKKSTAWLRAKVQQLGISLLVFPEGTISPDYYPLDFNNSAFVDAVELKRRIVPVTILGARNVFPYKSSPFDMQNSNKIKIVIGKPIVTDGYSKDDVSTLKAATLNQITKTLKLSESEFLNI